MEDDDTANVYARWTAYYNVYFKLLGSDVRAKSIEQFERDIARGGLAGGVWILDAHDIKLNSIDFENTYPVKVVSKLERKGAVARKILVLPP